MATDLAEFLGAALGFYLLFGIPMLPAAILTGVCVMLILAVEQLGFQWLERVIMFFVGVIGVSYAIEMFLSKPAWRPILTHVLVPEIHSSSIYLAVSMLGATVMPHVIYLHSALVLPRREELDRDEHHHRKMELIDVLLAMNGAWLINSAMVVMAAAVFFSGGIHVYSIEAAHATLGPLLGKFAGVAFAVALLCSGLSSSTVGTMAGQVILQGFMNFRISIFLRRIVTMIPAIVVIAWGLDPLKTLSAQPGGLELLPALCHDSTADAYPQQGLDGNSCQSPDHELPRRDSHRRHPRHEYLAAICDIDWAILSGCAKITP